MAARLPFIVILAGLEVSAVAWAGWQIFALRQRPGGPVEPTSKASSEAPEVLEEAPGHPPGQHGPDEGRT
jgi:hypothetical protein